MRCYFTQAQAKVKELLRLKEDKLEREFAATLEKELELQTEAHQAVLGDEVKVRLSYVDPYTILGLLRLLRFF